MHSRSEARTDSWRGQPFHCLSPGRHAAASQPGGHSFKRPPQLEDTTLWASTRQPWCGPIFASSPSIGGCSSRSLALVLSPWTRGPQRTIHKACGSFSGSLRQGFEQDVSFKDWRPEVNLKRGPWVPPGEEMPHCKHFSPFFLTVRNGKVTVQHRHFRLVSIIEGHWPGQGSDPRTNKCDSAS